MKILIAILCLLLGNLLRLSGQNRAQHTPLFEEIARMDSLLFDAFNRCDATQFRSFMTADNEFYHDKGGFSDLEATMKTYNKTVLTTANLIAVCF